MATQRGLSYKLCPESREEVPEEVTFDLALKG